MNTTIDNDITDSKQKYYTERINTYQNDAKNTWGVIREMLNKTNVKTTYPPFFLLNNKKINDKTEIANEFNKYFATVGNVLAQQIITPDKPYSY